jgi:hypothetical protein
MAWWNGRLRGSINFDRLRVRYEKRSDIHEAFLSLGCTSSAGILCEGPERRS